jgi:hypothetical protein
MTFEEVWPLLLIVPLVLGTILASYIEAAPEIDWPSMSSGLCSC